MTLTTRLTVAFSALGALSILSMGSRSAFAQSGNTVAVTKPYRLSIGVFVPRESEAQDTFGKRLTSIGGIYEFSKTTGATPTLVGFYLDYANGSSHSATYDLTQKYRHYGIGLSARELLAPSAKGGAYIGIGAGYYNINLTTAAVVPSTLNSAAVYDPVSNSYKKVGGKFFAGYEITQGLFAEADYTYIKKIDSLDVSGYEARIGIHF